MRARMWGTRGSLPTPGPGTHDYGGNTSCVQVDTGRPDHVVVLDAGTGIHALGHHVAPEVTRVDVLLGHLHMDHILGLGFFSPLFRPDLEVHLWGPGSPTAGLRDRLSRYLSPPLMPVRLRELPCRLSIHDVPIGTFDLPGLSVTAGLVCHPGPTVGYRLDDGDGVLVYLSDHEPALGTREFPEAPRWTSGYSLALDADVLIHDAQYVDGEYPSRIGWGHSTIAHTLAFAEMTGARNLVPFHHDPAHDDAFLDELYSRDEIAACDFDVTPAKEGLVVEVRSGESA